MSDVCGMRRTKVKTGGGWRAILYTLSKARAAGGIWRMWKALSTKNACKTCALGMGGQLGGMVNEKGHWPSLCKKSVQAMAADMQGAIQPEFFEKFSIAELKQMSPRELEESGRLTQPVYAAPGDTHYRRISWDDALARIAKKLRDTPPENTFFYFSGRSSNEAGFLLQLFSRLYGTNNVNNCSYYCHQASSVGLASVTGSGTATLKLDDVEQCDLLFLIGANPASNHPRFLHTILRMKRRKGKVIVINPVRELGLVRFRVPSDPWSLFFGTRIADEYVQPHIGGDIALLAAIGKALLERGAVEHTYIQEYTEDYANFEAMLRALDWVELVQRSGVSREQIQQLADLYAASQNTVFCWAMGVTHHGHGVENVQMIGNLALMRGMVGRPKAGLLPLRGHSNVQGIGSMGVTPRLKAAVLQRIQEKYGVTLPTGPGMDTLSSMEAAAEGRTRFAWCVGGNLYGSNPDAKFAKEALNAIDLVLYMSTTLNTGHACGTGCETIILPVLARDEESQATTQESMFNYVRMSDGGPARHEGPRSETEIIAHVAQDVLGDASPVDWKAMQQHGNIREAIAAIIPGYEEIAEMDLTRQEFHIPGRIFHAPKFATVSGRAAFHAIELPDFPDGDRTLRLMTIRSEGQFNTVVYEEEDLYRGQERRDVIMLASADRERLGLHVNQRVTVRSASGSLHNVLVRELNVRPGNAVMYYPEANVLVSRNVDPASRTPAFKNTSVTIETAAATREVVAAQDQATEEMIVLASAG
ncbi:MAG: FdhF/YdeP family oxidoreductase [Candidatus Sumerlaeaceae bacterium]